MKPPGITSRGNECFTRYRRGIRYIHVRRLSAIIGPCASELISEAVTIMAFAGSVEDVALTMHAHPTLSEAFKEAALGAFGKAIHA